MASKINRSFRNQPSPADFLVTGAPGSAKIIRLEDQPETVQTIYHWSGLLALIMAVLALLALIFGVMVWRQGQINGREADEKGGQSGDVEEGGTGGAGTEGEEGNPERGKVEGRTRTCLTSDRRE